MRVWFLGDFFLRGERDFLQPVIPFEEGDYVVSNYEGVFDEASRFSNNSVLLGQSHLSTRVAKTLKVTHFGVANNHILDYGHAACEKTIQELTAAGFEVAGVRGPNSSEAFSFTSSSGSIVEVIVVATSETGALTSAESNSEGLCNDAESNWTFQRIAANKRAGTFSVVYVHWGETNYRYPSQKTRALARRYARAGAQLIVGHHPHVIQGYERVSGADVYYSLGNFVFDSYFGRRGLLELSGENKRSLALCLNIDTKHTERMLVIYTPEAAEVSFKVQESFCFSTVALPLRLDDFSYSVFLKAYLIYRLLQRGVYWLNPHRIKQIGPRQLRALWLLVGKLLGARH